MNYIRQGHGNFLVLVHGALTDGSMWLPHIEYLQSDFEVISISLRHFEKPEIGGFGLNTHAEDLAALISGLHEDKQIYLVGWSYGADVILNMLIKHDLSISKLFLYEPGYPGCLQKHDLEIWQLDANAMFGKVFEHHSAGHLELAVKCLIDGSGNASGYFASQEEAVKRLQLSKAHTLSKQLNQQEEPAINILGVSRINTPMIVGFGSKTRDIFKLVAQATAHSSTAAEVLEIVGATHMLPQENPKAFSSYIQQTLSPKG